jgi:hypothetical protein
LADGSAVGGKVFLFDEPSLPAKIASRVRCAEDCNGNGTLDVCDILVDETSGDCNADLVPDECEPDCDGSGESDICEMLPGAVAFASPPTTFDFSGLVQNVVATARSADGQPTMLDIDGNGAVDIVASIGGSADDIAILLNNGAGGFPTITTIDLPTNSDPFAIAAGDFDGDFSTFATLSPIPVFRVGIIGRAASERRGEA